MRSVLIELIILSSLSKITCLASLYSFNERVATSVCGYAGVCDNIDISSIPANDMIERVYVPS
jgi:hypothetical protein